MPSPPPIRVNRAPALALWAAVVAERLGHAPDTAMSLAAILAGIAPPFAGRLPGAVALGAQAVLVPQAEGPPLADRGDGVGVPAAPVRAYLQRAFGARFAEAQAAMAALAVRQDPVILESMLHPLFAAFAPMPGEGAVRGLLDLGRLAAADCRA